MRQNNGRNANHALSLLILGLFLALLFLGFSWGNSLLRDSNKNEQIFSFEKENERMKEENENLKNQLEYLRSPQYRDKWAKEHKGLSRPNEKVIVIEFQEKIELNTKKEKEMKEKEMLLSRPNREQWKILFFHQTKAKNL